MSLDIPYRPLYDKIKSVGMHWLTISPIYCDERFGKRVNLWRAFLEENLFTLCEDYLLVFEVANERLHMHMVFSLNKTTTKQEKYLLNHRFNAFLNSLGIMKRATLPIFIKRPSQWKHYLGEPEKKIEYLFKDVKTFIESYGLFPVYDSGLVRSKAMESFFDCAYDHEDN